VDDSALLTDLYELHMMQSYRVLGMGDTAVFDFVVRRLSPGRNFLVAAGLEQVLDYLEDLQFTAAELAWLRGSGRFSTDFLAFLAGLRFSGRVDALPEGTACRKGRSASPTNRCCG
jgi:nicotinate phosphoribosyltransferase